MGIHTNADRRGLYFITFTCFRWLPLIEVAQSYDAVYKWFDYLSLKKHAVSGYVIMPNHLHLLMHYFPSRISINTIVSEGKRFMAYEIIKRLKIQQNHTPPRDSSFPPASSLQKDSAGFF